MREDRLNYIEKEISKTPLYSLLGADGISELKSRIIDIICDQVQKDLRDSSYYLISPDDVNETLGENIVQEAIDELKEEFEFREQVGKLDKQIDSFYWLDEWKGEY